MRIIDNEQRGIWLNLGEVIEPPHPILVTAILKNLCGKQKKHLLSNAHQDYICFCLLPAIQLLLHLHNNKERGKKETVNGLSK